MNKNRSSSSSVHRSDELLDIVDHEDRVVGVRWRFQLYLAGACNFRVINAFVKNRNGKIWIPRRSENKRIFPLCLDTSVGGHVISGENYLEAFVRELREELNLQAESIEFSVLGKLTPKTDGVSAFMNVYEMLLDSTPDYNTVDFCESYWLWPNELFNLLRRGEPAKDDLPKLLKYFYC